MAAVGPPPRPLAGRRGSRGSCRAVITSGSGIFGFASSSAPGETADRAGMSVSGYRPARSSPMRRRRRSVVSSLRMRGRGERRDRQSRRPGTRLCFGRMLENAPPVLAFRGLTSRPAPRCKEAMISSSSRRVVGLASARSLARRRPFRRPGRAQPPASAAGVPSRNSEVVHCRIVLSDRLAQARQLRRRGDDCSTPNCDHGAGVPAAARSESSIVATNAAEAEQGRRHPRQGETNACRGPDLASRGRGARHGAALAWRRRRCTRPQDRIRRQPRA